MWCAIEQGLLRDCEKLYEVVLYLQFPVVCDE